MTTLTPYKWREPSTISLRKRIGSAEVRKLCGGISDMTLSRWSKNKDMHFPKPARVGRRRYWIEAEVEKWIEANGLNLTPDDLGEYMAEWRAATFGRN